MRVDIPKEDVLNISLIIDENNTTHVKINPKEEQNLDLICGNVCKKYNLNEKLSEKLGKEINKRINHLMKDKISDKTVNRLYYESIEHNKEKEAFLDEIRREKENEILNKFNFSPNVNKISNFLYDRKHLKIEDKLYNEFKIIKEKHNYERLITEISERSKIESNRKISLAKRNSSKKIKKDIRIDNHRIKALQTSNNNKQATRNNNNFNNKILEKLNKRTNDKLEFLNSEQFSFINTKLKAGEISNFPHSNKLTEIDAKKNFDELSLIKKTKILNTDNSIEDSCLNLRTDPSDNLINNKQSSKEHEKLLKNQSSINNKKLNKKESMAKTPAFFKSKEIDPCLDSTGVIGIKKRNTYDSNNQANDLLTDLSKRFSYYNPNNEKNSYVKRFKTLNAKSSIFSNSNVKENLISNNHNNYLFALNTVSKNLESSLNFKRDQNRRNTVNNSVNQFKLNLNNSGVNNKVFDVISEEKQAYQYFNTMPKQTSNENKEIFSSYEIEKTENKSYVKESSAENISSNNLKNLQNNIFNIKLNENKNFSQAYKEDKSNLHGEKILNKKLSKALESATNLKYNANIFETAKKEINKNSNNSIGNKHYAALSSRQVKSYLDLKCDKNNKLTKNVLDSNSMSNDTVKKQMDNRFKRNLTDNNISNEDHRVNIDGNCITLRLKNENTLDNYLTSKFFDSKDKIKNDKNFEFCNTTKKQNRINLVLTDNSNTDSNLTITNIVDNTNLNFLKTESNELSKFISNHKDEFTLHKKKDNNFNKLNSRGLKTFKHNKTNNSNTKSLEVSKAKSKHLTKRERGNKDIFTYLYDTRNDTKIFRERLSKEVFSKICTFNPNITQSYSVEKSKHRPHYFRENENKQDFYRRLSESRHLKQSRNYSHLIRLSERKNIKSNELKSNDKNQLTNNLNEFKIEKNTIKNYIKKDLGFYEKHKEDKLLPNDKNKLLESVTSRNSSSNISNFDNNKYCSLSSRLENLKKPFSDKRVSNYLVTPKIESFKNKLITHKNTPVSQSLSYYDNNIIKTAKKNISHYLSITDLKATSENYSREFNNKYSINDNQKHNLNTNTIENTPLSDIRYSNKLVLPYEENKNYPNLNENYESKIINISVNDIIEEDQMKINNNTTINQLTDRNVLYLATEDYNLSNSEQNKNRYTVNLNGNADCLKDKTKKIKNGGSYFENEKRGNNNNNNSNQIDNFELNKIPKYSNNSILNYINKSDKNIIKKQYSLKIKNKSISDKSLKSKYENKKIREIKQEENLIRKIDDINQNKYKRDRLIKSKFNKNLERLKMIKLKEIYEIISCNINEIHRLKEFGISDFIVENIVFPFFELINERNLSFNFVNFQSFAYQTLGNLAINII